MTTASTWLPPNSPPKTNPPLTLNPAVAEADRRHRAHCRMCSDDPGDADAYVAALFAAHAPWLADQTPPAALQRPDRPRLAQLLTNRADS